MECNFIVGQEVICINDDPHAPPNTSFPGGLDGLKAGNHYHVASIYIDARHNLPCITVREIDRPVGYFAFRFRPVIKQSTDISELEKLLQTKVLENV